MGRKKGRIKRKSYKEKDKRKRRTSFEFVEETPSKKRRKRDDTGSLSQEEQLCPVKIKTKEKSKPKQYHICQRQRPCPFHDKKKILELPEEVVNKKWTTEDIRHKKLPKSPLKSGLNPKAFSKKEYSHLDVWKLIFDEEIMEHILDCTNNYAKTKYEDRKTPFLPISRKDLDDYFAIYFCLGLLKFPQEHFPWFENSDSVLSEIPLLYSNGFISCIMGKNRWMDIHHAIHCTAEEV